MNKPLAKSLHTVTVLVRVAQDIMARGEPNLPAFVAVHAAVELLGLYDLPDTYGLKWAAVKQLAKVSK